MRRVNRGFWQYAIPAIASAAGAYFGKKGQDDTNEENVALGREQMAFQERMSGSAWQRGVKDMQAANLNPMLAYSQGGASSPAGAMPQVGNSVQAGINSGSQAAQTVANIDFTKASTDKLRAETVDQNVTTAQQLATLRESRLRGDSTVEAIPGITADSNSKYMKYVADFGSEHADSKQVKSDSGFAADVRRRKADARSAELGLSESESISKFWDSAGDKVPYVRFLFEALRALSSARGVTR